MIHIISENNSPTVTANQGRETVLGSQLLTNNNFDYYAGISVWCLTLLANQWDNVGGNCCNLGMFSIYSPRWCHPVPGYRGSFPLTLSLSPLQACVVPLVEGGPLSEITRSPFIAVCAGLYRDCSVP